jgi:sortase (surface protein transpeptidase)
VVIEGVSMVNIIILILEIVAIVLLLFFIYKETKLKNKTKQQYELNQIKNKENELNEALRNTRR